MNQRKPLDETRMKRGWDKKHPERTANSKRTNARTPDEWTSKPRGVGSRQARQQASKRSTTPARIEQATKRGEEEEEAAITSSGKWRWNLGTMV